MKQDDYLFYIAWIALTTFVRLALLSLAMMAGLIFVSLWAALLLQKSIAHLRRAFRGTVVAKK